MKKILTFLMMLIWVQLVAQNYPVTSIVINLPAFPDANTANWGTGTSAFMIMANTSERALKEAMSSTILVTIKKGDSQVCGIYNNQTAPASSINQLTTVWSGRKAVSLLGRDCDLPPGEYKICVQFFLKGQKFSEEVCKVFTIKALETLSYQPPQAISPADGTVFNEADAKKPIAFRWTPITPRPREEVVYKIRIFEIRQGQTATTAVRSASPLLEKEVRNQTQFVLPSMSQLAIAKGSSYGWNVQAVGLKGNPIGENNGTSNVNTLKLSSSNCTHSADIVSIECLGMLNGLQQYKVCVLYKNTAGVGCTNCEILLNSPSNNQNSLGAGVTIGSLNAGTTINNILPGVPVGVTQGQQATICFNATVAPANSLKFVVLGVCNDAMVSTNFKNLENSLFDTIPPPCICTACDQVQINIPEQGTITIDSTLLLQTAVNVNPGGIKSVKAQLVYFEYKPESDDCVPCNRDSRDWGNFISSSLSDNEFPLDGQPTHGHEVQWVTSNASGASLNGNFNFHISLPPLVKCCNLDVKFCIRYIFEFIDCTVCEKVVCYSYSKTSK